MLQTEKTDVEVTTSPSPTTSESALPSARPVNDANKVPSEKAVQELPDDQYPHGLGLIFLAGASILAVFLIALDQTIVGNAIPKITDEFGGLEDVSWYAAAYFMTFGATQTSAGKVYKYFNLKYSFLISMLIFEIGSLICGIAPNSKTLVVGRAIAGLGGAGLSVGGTSIVSFTVPPAKRPMMMGIIGLTYCVAATLGPILGGVFTARVSWRWCFYINLPIGGVAAVAVFFFFHLPAAAAPPQIKLTRKLLHTDPVGIALAMACITCFILAFQHGGVTNSWGSSLVIGLLVGFVLLAATLVAWELWLGEYAMFLPRLWKHRSLPASAAYSFFFMGSYVVLLYYLPIYFQSILDVTPLRSGVMNLPLVTAAAVFALIGGAVVMKTGRAQQVVMAGTAITTIAVGLVYTFDMGTSTAKWAGVQFFVGAVMAFAIMHGLTIVQAYVGPEDISAATANMMFFQTVGSAFSTAGAQSAFANRLLAHLASTAPDVNPGVVLSTGASDLRHVFSSEVLPRVLDAYMVGLKAAFAVAVGFSGAAFLCSLAIPMRKLPTHESGSPPMAVA